MMFARAVLIIPGAIFFIYGAMCWYNPELPAEYAGLWVAHQDGLAELAAMYGGLQLCLGSIIFLSGILKGYLRPGLWLLMMVLGGLAAARGSVAFGNFDLTVQAAQGAADVAMSSDFTGYTWYALLFEATFALLAGLCCSIRKTKTERGGLAVQISVNLLEPLGGFLRDTTTSLDSGPQAGPGHIRAEYRHRIGY